MPEAGLTLRLGPDRLRRDYAQCDMTFWSASAKGGGSKRKAQVSLSPVNALCERSRRLGEAIEGMFVREFNADVRYPVERDFRRTVVGSS
jgi:hypothetical protein